MERNQTHRSTRWLWIIAFVLSLITIVIVVRRTLFLIPVLDGTYVPKPAPFPEEGFANNPILTLLHILPAIIFVLMGLLQFNRKVRTNRPTFHRWNGRALIILGMLIGVSGIVMGFKMAISGVAETAATTLFGSFFLFALAKAYTLARRGMFDLHREWMIRAFAIGLAVSTTRPIVGIFFATSPLTGLTPQDFFGAALWIGFTLHLIGAEVWINATRPPAMSRS